MIVFLHLQDHSDNQKSHSQKFVSCQVRKIKLNKLTGVTKLFLIFAQGETQSSSIVWIRFFKNIDGKTEKE